MKNSNVFYLKIAFRRKFYRLVYSASERFRSETILVPIYNNLSVSSTRAGGNPLPVIQRIDHSRGIQSDILPRADQLIIQMKTPRRISETIMLWL